MDQTTGYKETSRTAWLLSETRKARLASKILNILTQRGEVGATDEELDDLMGTADSRSSRPARLHLRNDGYVRDSGVRRMTRSDRPAIVWVLTPEDEVAAQREKLMPSILKRQIKKTINKLEYQDLLRVYRYIETLHEINNERKRRLTMNEARWFLAHTKQDEDKDIDAWSKRLTEMLADIYPEDWTAKIVPGRDDYEARAKAMGGWRSWCRDVPQAEDYMGEPMFHGAIVPADALDEAPTVGRATAKLIAGFIEQGKRVYTWCPSCEELRLVTEVVDNEDDSWKAWSTLVFDEQDRKEQHQA